ncbi:thiamine phosphate synthase [Pelagibacteraceae bacterium]|nr:thiamine phosphate synthase [Pelagibacteraceae bacterium]MDC0952969.1 thiamine phosphate synthase [Pelagibacteraceae bacterium]
MKKLVYLISPNKIDKKFYSELDSVLSYGNVKFFQLRLKNFKFKNLVRISKKIKKITKKHKVNFLINDNYMVAVKSKADGCHMGQLDGSIKKAKIKLKNKIIGVTCHNSKILARKAIEDKANYLAFGSFYKSKLKPDAKKANLSIIRWSKKNFKKPIVVIGGITNLNYKRLVRSGAKYIALSSFIWDNPNLKPELAIRKFK